MILKVQLVMNMVLSIVLMEKDCSVDLLVM